MLPSYGGSILHVDLSRKHVDKRVFSEDLCKRFIGGKGFGTKLLYDLEVEDADPLSPNNPLIITVGPAAGTLIPLASKVNFNFKSPLTKCYGESQMGGYFAPKLKWAGYDVILIRGASDKPVYLYVDENGGELRDASHLWGKTTQETEAEIKKDVGKDAAVLEIGPAGEKLVKFACICHAEGWRQAGRAGVGAVMGSKKLKAVAVDSDRKEVEVFDLEMVRGVVNDVNEHIKRDPVGTLAENYRKYGTARMVEVANELRFFPTRYWHDVFFEKYEEIGPKAMSKYVTSSRACWNCPFACGKLVEIRDGPYAGTKVEGPEYETIFAFGGLCEIDDIAAIAKINELCDIYGIDTITMGNVAGFAIEAYKMGKLEVGRSLDYSDPEAVIWLIEQIVNREGVGDILAEGVKSAAAALNVSDLAIETRGLEPPGYDPRSLKGMALAYALSSRGACHLRAIMYAADLSGNVDRFSIPTEKVSIYLDNEDRYNIFDTLVLCRFGRNIYGWERLVRIVKGLTGLNYDVDYLKKISQKIQTLIRLFNIKCGCDHREDKVSKRFMNEPVKVGEKILTVDEKELQNALNQYYLKRGWDERGIPKPETVRELSENLTE